MAAAVKKQDKDFDNIVEAIADERVRYFYLMLGDALARANAPKSQPGLVNTSPAHVSEIAARLNRR